LGRTSAKSSRPDPMCWGTKGGEHEKKKRINTTQKGFLFWKGKTNCTCANNPPPLRDLRPPNR